jgi:hypothetical protein
MWKELKRLQTLTSNIRLNPLLLLIKKPGNRFRYYFAEKRIFTVLD